jgi:hypothetical protein
MRVWRFQLSSMHVLLSLPSCMAVRVLEHGLHFSFCIQSLVVVNCVRRLGHALLYLLHALWRRDLECETRLKYLNRDASCVCIESLSSRMCC